MEEDGYAWAVRRKRERKARPGLTILSHHTTQPMFLGVNLLSREGYSQAGDRMMAVSPAWRLQGIEVDDRYKEINDPQFLDLWLGLA